MDASQYKDYVLTLLFMKYVSDKYAADPGALIEVPAGGGFADMAKLKGDKEIGDRINKIIGRLAEANDLKGVIDQADFNDESRLGAGKEMQDRLSKLVAIFEGLDFRANRAGGRRPAGRRLRVPDAALRHRVGQEQGAVLHPGGGLARHGPGGRHRAGHPPGPDHLRPHLRLRLAAAESGRRGASRHQRLRPGDGQRHLGAGADEHDPARPRDRRAPARQHAGRPGVQAPERRRPRDLRLRGRQSALLRQGVVQRPRPGARRLRALRVRHPAGQERRLRLPPAPRHIAQEQGQGRHHPAPRGAVPKQPGGRHPP